MFFSSNKKQFQAQRCESKAHQAMDRTSKSIDFSEKLLCCYQGSKKKEPAQRDCPIDDRKLYSEDEGSVYINELRKKTDEENRELRVQ